MRFASFAISSTESWNTDGMLSTGMAHAFAGHDEQRVDEGVQRQPRLLHHAAPDVVLTQAARTIQREGHD